MKSMQLVVQLSEKDYALRKMIEFPTSSVKKSYMSFYL